ncbi:GTPase [Cellulomonas sp. PhB143]|uniref:GTPase n=1 Tax=Cellulomonas sp. PhB143 TaxID=2485186 RepID=UPI000F465771|nr:GTPase [Cellulomonas sp. PhB143]ROS77047.1 GTP-binding protein EngB required for normal cell division [Cellulomonas sp. PhB143]
MAGIGLEARTRALGGALAAGEGRLPPQVADRARRVVELTEQRTALSAEHTVVAVAGATGSGKSTLVNALAGARVAEPGVLRPTTARARAAVESSGTPGEGDGARALLDWLEVSDRVDLPPGDGSARGLVLLDLPDHDSVVVEHRLRAERLVERADLLVWVVDPQKYADAALHERFLRPLARHQDVVVLVVNQVDRLEPEEAAAVAADLARLAAQDGLPDVRVLAASALTGEGVPELRRMLAQAADRREAATARLAAGVRAAAEEVLEACGDGREPGPPGRERLVDGLERAAGVDTVVRAVRAAAVRDARAATGWPVTRWLARFRPDPLRRIGLRDVGERADLVRTSLPVARSSASAASRSAVRDAVREATAAMPPRWAQAARDRVERSADALPDALDRAVAGTSLGAAERPWWWRAVNVLQWLVLGVGALGLVWLGVLAVAGYLRVTEPTTPSWWGLPVPTVLVLGALVVGLVVAGASRLAAGAGARVRARQVRRRLRRAVGAVADEHVRLPLAEEQAELARCRTSAVIAAG